MKNKIKILGLFAGVFLLLYSCKEDELLTYSEESNIYFPNQVFYDGVWDLRIAIQIDDNIYASPEIGFGKSKKAQDTLDYTMARGNIVIIPVRIMGPLSDQKREFACRAIANPTAGVAVEGTHFKILDAFVPGNSRNGGIFIELLDEAMDDEEVLTIEFELQPNENFQTNFYYMPRESGSDEYVSTLHLTLKYSKLLLPPQYWDAYFKGALGTWSIKKISVLATYLEFDITDKFLYKMPPPDGSLMLGFGVALRKWLDEYKKEHGVPYYEKDNVTEMKAGDMIYSLY